MTKKTDKKVDKIVAKVTKDIQDNLYMKDFLTQHEKETGLKTTRFTHKKKQFLHQLVACNGFITTAAQEMGYFHGSVRLAMQSDPAFSQAVKAIQNGFLTERLDALEKLSYTQALKAGNITERIFQLKAHAPEKYRERQRQQNTQVNVMISGTSPKDRADALKNLKIRR